MPGSSRAERKARVTSGVVISTRIVPGGWTSEVHEANWACVGDQFAVINVSNMAAAFGFVHVVRCDEKVMPCAESSKRRSHNWRRATGSMPRSAHREKVTSVVKHGAAEARPASISGEFPAWRVM